MKPLRPRSLGTKLTEVEYARVEAAALKAGVGLSEWCRRAVLEFAERDGAEPAEKVVRFEDSWDRSRERFDELLSVLGLEAPKEVTA